MTKLLVFAETYNNLITPVSIETITYAASSLKNVEINALIATAPEYADELAEQLKNKGLDNLFLLVSPVFADNEICTLTGAISDFLAQNHQNILLVGATALGRELAPRVTSSLNLGLTADCTMIDIDEQGKLLATRPTYGGQLMAVISSKTDPNCATIRPGALVTTGEIPQKSMNINRIEPQISRNEEAVKVIKREFKAIDNSLEAAKIVVAGGAGLRSSENFGKMYRLAEKLGISPASSRAAVELGWAEQTIQVGQTGHTIAPDLYIALGISGAIQHLVGITNAKKVIAINSDPNAPIFQCCDIGIVADAQRVLDALLAE